MESCEKMNFCHRSLQCTGGVVESNVLHVAPLIVWEVKSCSAKFKSDWKASKGGQW